MFTMLFWIGLCYNTIGNNSLLIWLLWIIVLLIFIAATFYDPRNGIKNPIEFYNSNEDKELWNTGLIMLCIFNPLFTISVWFSIFFSCITLLFVIRSLVKNISSQSSKGNEDPFPKLMLLGFALFYLYPFYLHYYGNDIVGSFWSKSEFETENYVLIRHENSTKVELAIADIFVKRTLLDFGDIKWDDCDITYIQLESVKLTNGEVLQFDGCCISSISKETCFAQNRHWEIELTNKKPE